MGRWGPSEGTLGSLGEMLGSSVGCWSSGPRAHGVMGDDGNLCDVGGGRRGCSGAGCSREPEVMGLLTEEGAAGDVLGGFGVMKQAGLVLEKIDDGVRKKSRFLGS